MVFKTNLDPTNIYKALFIIQPYTNKIGMFLISNDVIDLNMASAFTNDGIGVRILYMIINIEYNNNNTMVDYYFRHILTELSLTNIIQMLKVITKCYKIM